MLNFPDQPLVSILLNCYNASKVINKAITSVIMQSYQNWELVIWDDGSNDNTIEICKEFFDKRIKIHKNNLNCGLGKSRIFASDFLKGELVSILDADDYFEPKKIEKQVEIFKKFPSVSICSTWSKIYNERYKLIRVFQTDIDNFALKKRLNLINVLPHSSIMYRKKDAIACGWYSGEYEYIQDYDLTLKLIDEKEIYLLQEYLTNITELKTNMSNSYKLKSLVMKENISVLKKNLMRKHLSKKECFVIKNLIDIYYIKFGLSFLKKNPIKSLTIIIKIIFKNIFVLLNLNLIKKLTLKKNIN